MTLHEIARLQAYLRKTFGNDHIAVDPPSKRDAPTELRIGGEFIGTLHRDEDEGEVSYALHVTILEEDLPATGSLASKSKG